MTDSENMRSAVPPGRATIKEAAAAKINLFLHVGAKRADGFHPVQSLAVFTAMGDVLAMEAAPDLSLAFDVVDFESLAFASADFVSLDFASTAFASLGLESADVSALFDSPFSRSLRDEFADSGAPPRCAFFP